MPKSATALRRAVKKVIRLLVEYSKEHPSSSSTYTKPKPIEAKKHPIWLAMDGGLQPFLPHGKLPHRGWLLWDKLLNASRDPDGSEDHAWTCALRFARWLKAKYLADSEQDDSSTNQPPTKWRPRYERDHQFFHWSQEGMKPAAIRDRWNKEHPEAMIGVGESGRDLVKKGILTARKEQEERAKS